MELGWPIGGSQLNSNEKAFLLQSLKAKKIANYKLQKKKVLNFGGYSFFCVSLNLECFLFQ